MPAIPDRWIPYKACGIVIEGTKFICFKVPLKKVPGSENLCVIVPWLKEALERDYRPASREIGVSDVECSALASQRRDLVVDLGVDTLTLETMHGLQHEYVERGRVLKHGKLGHYFYNQLGLRSVQTGVQDIKEIWDIPALLNTVPNLGAVVDLTNTARYYNPGEFKAAGIEHRKILMPGRIIPPEYKVIEFMDTIDEFLARDPESLIGIHCTHGLNRTGYMVCRYMRDRLEVPAKDAIKRFEKARGYQIERDNYLADLLGRPVPAPDVGSLTNIRPQGETGPSHIYRAPATSPADRWTRSPLASEYEVEQRNRDRHNRYNQGCKCTNRCDRYSNRCNNRNYNRFNGKNNDEDSRINWRDRGTDKTGQTEDRRERGSNESNWRNKQSNSSRENSREQSRRSKDQSRSGSESSRSYDYKFDY